MTHPSFVALAAQLLSCVSFLADVYSILFHFILFSSILFYSRLFYSIVGGARRSSWPRRAASGGVSSRPTRRNLRARWPTPSQARAPTTKLLIGVQLHSYY